MSIISLLKPVAAPISRFASKVCLTAAKHSPEILVSAGIVSCAVGAVMACNATLKADVILDEHAENMEKIKNAFEHNEPGMVKYTEEDVKRDTAVAYAKTVKKFVKLYGPSAGLFLVGVISILSGYRIISGRLAASAAFAQAQKMAFDKYRKNIIEEHGEEADLKAFEGLEKRKLLSTEVGPDGKEHEVEKEVYVKTGESSDLYAVVFDEMSSKYWEKDAYRNRVAICHAIATLEDRLFMKHSVTLAEVFEALGMDDFLRENNPTLWKESTRVGWVYGKGNLNKIDLGLYDVFTNDKIANQTRTMFINGVEPNILIKPNVDGVIYDLL